MNRYIAVVLINLLWCTCSFAQPDTLWTKTFGGASADGGRSVCLAPDGGFLITYYIPIDFFLKPRSVMYHVRYR